MRVGTVAIVGRPNAGKSTFVNMILDYNLSIVAPTPQTTRNCIKGIYNDDESQIIFIDTPGIHKPKSKLGVSLNVYASDSLKGIDLVLFLTPGNEKLGPGDKFVLKKTAKVVNKIAVITKTDLVEDTEKLRIKSEKIKKFGYELVLGISLLTSHGVKQILPEIKNRLPEGELLYPNTTEISDLPTSFFVKEIIRGKAMANVYEEVVHSIEVVLTSYQESQHELKVDAIIYVERESQKGILIGKNGSMVKKIGIDARQAIADFVGIKTHLNLIIKVEKNWTKKEDKLKILGY